MRANNLTLLTDLYELTMMQGYFKNPTDQTVVFDMFYRDNPCGGGFAICAGLEQVIEYIENLRFTDEDIEYLRSLPYLKKIFWNIFALSILQVIFMQSRKVPLFSRESLW